MIRRELKYAVKTDLISEKPADKVGVPRKISYQANFFSAEEFSVLFRELEGSRIEIPVKIASFYGLRRSEVLGLKWDAIDFAGNTLSIKHTVTGCIVDGKYTEIASDSTKTKSSMRTLPLTEPVRKLLLELRKNRIQTRS